MIYERDENTGRVWAWREDRTACWLFQPCKAWDRADVRMYTADTEPMYDAGIGGWRESSSVGAAAEYSADHKRLYGGTFLGIRYRGGVKSAWFDSMADACAWIAA